MVKTVAIGVQDYAKLIEEQNFYVDKTEFIREWWESSDANIKSKKRRYYL